MRKGIFITGTNTDIGKTYITGLLTQLLSEEYHCGYYKAALSGALKKGNCLIPEDALHVQQTAHLKQEDLLVSHIYEHAYSPHLSASVEQCPFSIEKVKKDIVTLEQTHTMVIAEGSGGIICPLRLDSTVTIMLSDVMKLLAYPLLIVSSSDLGAINATLLTIHYAQSLQLPILGIILNHFDARNPIHIDNFHVIEQMSCLPILSTVSSHGELSNPEMIKHAIDSYRW